MKCSLGISNFLEEISSPSHSIVFLYTFIQPSPKVTLPPGHSHFITLFICFILSSFICDTNHSLKFHLTLGS